VKFIPSHVQFFSKSNSENGIKTCHYLTKLQTKPSWLLFVAHSIYRKHRICLIFLKILQYFLTLQTHYY